MNRADAHTRIGATADLEFHPLEEHLRNTAERAGAFAKAFDSEPWGYLAGLWHDLGKYQEECRKGHS